MPYELKDNSGSLFENDRKQSDRHPDMTGKVMVNGVEMYVSAWWKQGRSQFLSLAFSDVRKNEVQRQDDRREPQRSAGYAAPRKGGWTPPAEDLDDAVPFAASKV